ncbi:BamA/TamA family outer membrane protein [Persicobacter diffluens]|uniref:Bacterial surface antigen (D15) domain-containing protein n=1 Tax=Persicobacter diffluens TaxID=981 RepID=A0AAN5ANV1_9BACT|nr:hypothetical protein PEDI_37600 [Persicobacter diffluens]
MKRNLAVKVLALALMTLVFPQWTMAQDAQDAEQINANLPEKGKLYLAPIPVLASNPAFGFVYGAAASGGIFFGDPQATRMSSALLTATYSTKNQLMFTFKPIVYTNNDDWNLLGDYRVFFSSQNTYGLGTGAPATPIDDYLGEQPMDFDLIRLHQTALRKIKPNLYAGMGYHLDVFSNIDDTMLDEEGQRIETDHDRYSKEKGFETDGYTISGVSANLIYDSRDNVANPYSGRYAFLSYKMNAEFLGSTKGSSTLWMEYRDYFSVSKKNPRNLIALWTYGHFVTSGDVPYMALPSIGWDQMGRSGRAFPQGRFRGENIYYLEAEYRFGIPVVRKNPDLLGGVIFANTTSTSSAMDEVKLFQEMQVAVGAGLRVMINKKARTNLAIDYGRSFNGEGAVYIGLTEYF